MLTEEFELIVNAQIERSTSVLIEKAKEYSSDTDRLHNFKVASEIMGVSTRQALAGMMVKHTTSIYDMCVSNSFYSEDMINEKITDHINYLLLLRAVFEEELTLGQSLPETITHISNEFRFNSVREAKEIRRSIEELISNQGFASLSDALDMMGVASNDDEWKIGWRDFKKTSIKQIGPHACILTPPPTIIL